MTLSRPLAPRSARRCHVGGVHRLFNHEQGLSGSVICIRRLRDANSQSL